MNKTKKQRLETVNKIIKKISSTGRFFFKSKGRVAHIEMRNGGHLYWYNPYTERTVGINCKTTRKPRHFDDGGTLWGLVQGMIEFVATGEQKNGENGYGGLYCTHWGYSENEMLEIRDWAVELGYLEKTA